MALSEEKGGLFQENSRKVSKLIPNVWPWKIGAEGALLEMVSGILFFFIEVYLDSFQCSHEPAGFVSPGQLNRQILNQLGLVVRAGSFSCLRS